MHGCQKVLANRSRSVIPKSRKSIRNLKPPCMYLPCAFFVPSHAHLCTLPSKAASHACPQNQQHVMFGTEFACEYLWDLKSRVPKGTYRFDSGPGHQVEFLGDPS